MKSIEVKLYLDKRYKKGNTYPVKIQMYFQKKRLYIPLSFYFTLEEWDIISDRTDKSKSLRINVFGNRWQEELLSIRRNLDNELIKVTNIIADLSGKEEKFCMNDVKRLYDCDSIIISNDDTYKVLTWHNQNLKMMTEKRCASKTIKIYENAFRQLKNFYLKKDNKHNKIENLRFQEIDSVFLKKFENFIIRDCKNSPATVAQHMRCIRRLFNLAKQNNVDIIYPFTGKDKYSIQQVKSRKSALTEDELKGFFGLREKISKQQLRNYDYAVISFLMNGANLMDIALLKNKDINEAKNEISFIRHKTHQTKTIVEPIIINITEELQYYLNLYSSNNKDKNAYHFDILRKQDIATEQNITNRVDATVHSITKTLKAICKKYNIHNGEVNYQMFRHTFATLYALGGGSPYILQQAMGHANFKTTENYIKSLPHNSDTHLDKIKKIYLPQNFLNHE